MKSLSLWKCIVLNEGANMLNNLTAEQKNILQIMQPVLGLAADIAHAVVTIYIPHVDKKWLTIYQQEQPRTHVGSSQPDLTGRNVRVIEEPIINRCLNRSIPVMGKRELNLGSFSSFRVYPLQDSRGKCFGAISFDTSIPDDIIIQQALELLLNMKASVADNEQYGRLQPADGIMIVDDHKMVVAANNQARHIFQTIDVPDLVGRHTNHMAINWPLVGMVMDTGIAESKELMFRGLLLSIRVLPVVAKPKGGWAIVILQDVTELRKKDQELQIKTVVIKEIHHRVKNNLQTIASLLRMQARRAQSQETKDVLRDCVGRVNSIAIVHEYLSQQDSGLIDVDKVAKEIYKALLSSMLSPDFKLDAHFYVEKTTLPSEKATSVALILNELLQNAIEHGFEGKNSGRLDVSFKLADDKYELTIRDDGAGLPAGVDVFNSKSLGLKIIKTLAEADLRGSFTLQNGADCGTIAKVVIPYEGDK